MKVIKLPNGGELHEANGNKWWYLNDQLHRVDGPALDFPNRKEWWLNGEQIPCTTQKQFLQLMKLKAFW
jgi:hypothetical protein